MELIGYCGTAVTTVAYAMKTSIRLRVAGMLGGMAFLAYGGLTGNNPVMLMQMVVLPLNALRLVEILLVRSPCCADDAGAHEPR
ncbi:MAG: YgjV family protein [Pseudochelatococcus sp.]|uniref:YgjV family protein n=1 Tax=Pseudochelatococcus sp. TaxID=2020869 RepID=UPI003D910A00